MQSSINPFTSSQRFESASAALLRQQTYIFEPGDGWLERPLQERRNQANSVSFGIFRARSLCRADPFDSSVSEPRALHSASSSTVWLTDFGDYPCEESLQDGEDVRLEILAGKARRTSLISAPCVVLTVSLI
jgi:hypothetical protein